VNSAGRTGRTKSFLAFLAGTLLAASFPKFNQAWLAWLTPGLILFLARSDSQRGICRMGFIAGLGNYLVSLSWMLSSASPIKAFFGFLIVCAIQSAYLALWCWTCWTMFPRRSPAPGETAPSFAGQFQSLTFRQRLTWPLLCAAAWVAMEMAMARCSIGFPWNFLAVSQIGRLSLIQIASITGVFGVSFLVAWMSISLLTAAALMRGGLKSITRVLLQLAVPVLACLFTIYFGAERLLEPENGFLPLRIALIQPAFPQKVLAGAAESTNDLAKLRELTQTALKAQPDLIVVPELAGPDALQSIADLVRTQHLWLVTGSRLNSASTTTSTNAIDGAFLVDPNGPVTGQPAQIYRRRYTLPFGEALPAVHFVRAESNVVFQIEKPRVRFSPLMNGEDLVPHEVRRRADASVDFLLRLRGESSIGRGAAQWQHAANAVFRALENGLPLVRCANFGLNCWIDSCGRVHDAYFGNPDDIYQAGCKIVEVPLYLATPGHPPTFFNRHGDWFGWSCVAVVIVALLSQLFRQGQGSNPLPAGGDTANASTL
jgi:apolipoprotein N-acyltransferase